MNTTPAVGPDRCQRWSRCSCHGRIRAAVAAVEERVDAPRVTGGQETQRAQPVLLARADEAVADVEHRRHPAALAQHVQG